MTSFELKSLIAKAIEPTIGVHRKSTKSRSFNYPYVTEGEVNSFLMSIPYFENQLALYLITNGVKNGYETCLQTSDEWEESFLEKVNLWANSENWLKGDYYPIHHPANKKDLIQEENILRLPNRVLIVRF